MLRLQMEMFDDIRCEWLLPLPDDPGELAGLDWANTTFQTKSLARALREYCIRKDGMLWCRATIHGDSGGRTGGARDDWEPVEHFYGKVGFYASFDRAAHDYRVEWTARFADSRLQDLRLSQWEVLDNSDRLRHEAEEAAQEARTARFLKSWVGRWLYPPYAWLVGLLLEKIAVQVCEAASGALSRTSLLVCRLGTRLTPHGNPIAARRLRREIQAVNDNEEDYWDPTQPQKRAKR